MSEQTLKFFSAAECCKKEFHASKQSIPLN